MPTDFRGSALRVEEHLRALARCSASPSGITRLYLTPEHRAANGLVSGWMQEAGLEPRVDETGTVIGRREGSDPSLPPILLGSHIDTVVNAGAYDGCLGVACAVEAARVLAREGATLRHPLEVAGFGEEEGVRFGVTFLGSRGIAGTWTPDLYEAKDREGVSVRSAMRSFGLDPDAVPRAAHRIAAYFEFHIEQGPNLAASGVPFGIVAGIAAAKRFRVTFTGKTGHAGMTPMAGRRDALCAASEFVLEAEEEAKRIGRGAVATVGDRVVTPGVTNCIPEAVTLTLDARAGTDEDLEELLSRLFDRSRASAARRSVALERDCYYSSKAVACSEALKEILRSSVREMGFEPPEMFSMAGHDAAAIGEKYPVAMAFVRDAGIGHSPKEHCDAEDVARTVELTVRAVRAADAILP